MFIFCILSKVFFKWISNKYSTINNLNNFYYIKNAYQNKKWFPNMISNNGTIHLNAKLLLLYECLPYFGITYSYLTNTWYFNDDKHIFITRIIQNTEISLHMNKSLILLKKKQQYEGRKIYQKYPIHFLWIFVLAHVTNWKNIILVHSCRIFTIQHTLCRS